MGEIIIEVKRKAEENSKAPVMMISATEGFINQSERYSSNNAGKSLKKYTLLKKGELAYNHGYSKTRNFGSCFTLEIEQARIPFVYHSFSLKGENDSVFWGKYLNSGLFDGKLRRLVASTARMDGLLNISFENYSSMPVNIPSLPEQKKIAAFFTLLDRRIQKQRQLVEFLKTYKRGVMNKLFDKNIEFNKYLKWEKVDEIFKTINDKPYQVQSCSYFQNGLYDIVDQGKKEIVGFCDYNDKLFIDVPVIIYGDHTTLVKYREKKFIVGGDGVKLLKSRDSNINLKYLYYALLRYNIKLEGYKRHFSILKEVSLPIFEKCIQDEIAKIITCIDSYIKLHENKLSSLLSLKSSLLQKMFI